MIIGDSRKIDLSTSSFRRMITNGNLYVDKTRFIENFLQNPNSVQLIARQRRLGKSLNMDMLRCFLTDKKDTRTLFKGLYVESSPVWEKVNSAPIFHFDFKSFTVDTYKKALYGMMHDYIKQYCKDEHLSWLTKEYLNNKDFDDPAGLRHLTESVYKATGKRSYLLIDEYDHVLISQYNTDAYNDIRRFMTDFLSAGVKGNDYIEKILLTGVMRISHESMLSGLNNIVTYDVFADEVYTDDYGLTEKEITELAALAHFDIPTVRAWYNGIRIGGHAIYNIYAIMFYITHNKLGCYWGKSGTMDMIISMLNNERREVLARLLNGEQVEVSIVNRVSLRQLAHPTTDQAFYSFLVQAGYLALLEAMSNDSTSAIVYLPNTELKIVWQQFVLETFCINTPKMKTLFDHADDLDAFAYNIEYFLRDRLSYHDLTMGKGDVYTTEQLYHIFVLGILSAYEDVRCQYPLSNRESGGGRYDILVQKPEANYIIEFKTADNTEALPAKANEALQQIETKRYGQDLGQKKLVRVGIAFCGKQCKVVCHA